MVSPRALPYSVQHCTTAGQYKLSRARFGCLCVARQAKKGSKHSEQHCSCKPPVGHLIGLAVRGGYQDTGACILG